MLIPPQVKVEYQQNILSPATGDPILTPSQDMVLGCYYLTTLNAKLAQKRIPYFSDLNDVYKAYANKHLHAHNFIWLRWKDPFYSSQPGKKVIEIRLRRFRKKVNETTIITSNTHKTHFIRKSPSNPLTEGVLKDQFIRTTVGRVILNQEFRKHINGPRLKIEDNGYSIPLYNNLEE